MPESGLRESKKLQTRQLIADTAAGLFRDLGYDQVTVEDVAAAAQVSRKTVFNYFPSKEDLVFSHLEERDAAILAAVRHRPDGCGLLESFRRMCYHQARDLAVHRHAAGGPGELFHMVTSHPLLQRRMHEANVRLVHAVAAAIVEESGADRSDPVPELVAWTLIGAYRLVHRRTRDRLAAGASDQAVVRAARRDVDRLFDQLAAGFATD